MPYWVYILQSEANGKTYIGQTDDLHRRIFERNDPTFRLTLYQTLINHYLRDCMEHKRKLKMTWSS